MNSAAFRSVVAPRGALAGYADGGGVDDDPTDDIGAGIDDMEDGDARDGGSPASAPAGALSAFGSAPAAAAPVMGALGSYALPQIDIGAALDQATQRYRQAVAWQDPQLQAGLAMLSSTSPWASAGLGAGGQAAAKAAATQAQMALQFPQAAQQLEQQGLQLRQQQDYYNLMHQVQGMQTGLAGSGLNPLQQQSQIAQYLIRSGNPQAVQQGTRLLNMVRQQAGSGGYYDAATNRMVPIEGAGTVAAGMAGAKAGAEAAARTPFEQYLADQQPITVTVNGVERSMTRGAARAAGLLNAGAGAPEAQSGAPAASPFSAIVQGGENTTGNPAATPPVNPATGKPVSSAMGNQQFEEGTWLPLARKLWPQETMDMSDEQVLALRADPGHSAQATNAYAVQNAGTLQQAGIKPTAQQLWLAHHFGPMGAIDIANADPTEQMSDLIGDKAAANNGLLGKTVADVQAQALRATKPLMDAGVTGVPALDGQPAPVAPIAAAENSLSAAPPVGKRVLTPEQEEATKKDVGQRAELFSTAQKNYIENQGAAQNLSDMIDALKIVQSGKTTGIKGDVGAWAAALGISPDFMKRYGVDVDQAGNIQIAGKAANQFVGSLVREQGSNPAFKNWMEIRGGSPEVEKTPEANREILATLVGKMNWQNDMYEAMEKAGSPQKPFPLAQWNKDHPLTDYVQKARESIGPLAGMKAEAAPAAAASSAAPAPSTATARPQTQALAALPKGYTEDTVVSQARAAVSAGKDPGYVRSQLQKYGIDPSKAGL